MIEGRPHRKILLNSSWKSFKEIFMQINENLLSSLKSCLIGSICSSLCRTSPVSHWHGAEPWENAECLQPLRPWNMWENERCSGVIFVSRTSPAAQPDSSVLAKYLRHFLLGLLEKSERGGEREQKVPGKPLKPF